jgi:hypothetical protein
VLLLVLLYQTQSCEHSSSVSPHTVERLAHHCWFPAILGELRDAGVYIRPIVLPLFRSTLSAVQSKTDDRTELCNFAEQLVDKALDENMAELVIQYVFTHLYVSYFDIKIAHVGTFYV